METFQNWIALLSIEYKLITAFFSESKEKAEIPNRNPLHILRYTMLGARKKLPAALWTETVRLANYVHNRLRMIGSKDSRTLLEIVHSCKPDLSRPTYI